MHVTYRCFTAYARRPVPIPY